MSFSVLVKTHAKIEAYKKRHNSQLCKEVVRSLGLTIKRTVTIVKKYFIICPGFKEFN